MRSAVIVPKALTVNQLKRNYWNFSLLKIISHFQRMLKIYTTDVKTKLIPTIDW